MGVAVGGLRASGAYRAANAGAGRSETNFEAFYTWQINDNLHLSPHYVHIQKPAGFAANGDVSVLGLRTKASF